MDDAKNEKLLRSALAEAPKEFLACRDIRHLWAVADEFAVVGETPQGKVVQRVMDCSRCSTRRVERHLLRMDRWGVYRMESLGSSYAYPEKYLIPEMTRADHGREILRAVRFAQLVES